MDRRKVGRSSKTLGILIVAGLLELTGYGPSWIAGWIGAGVGTAIAPFAIELGLAPDYTKFRVIPVDELEDQSPEILRGLEAYNRKDFGTAYRIWLPLAESGDPEAQYRIGRLFSKGDGVEQDYDRAVKWYSSGANQNHSKSMTGLGVYYYNGWGIDADLDLAYALLNTSRKMGDPYASNILAISYEIGRGVEPDGKKALDLHIEAMKLGVCAAANDIALMYKDPPKGLEPDLSEAYRYALHAKKMGCPFPAYIFYLRRKLSDHEISRAEETPVQ